MLIDFHTHYLAQEHLRIHAKSPDGRTIGSSVRGSGKDAVLEANGMPMGTACNPEDDYNLDRRLEYMTRSGMDMQVLSPPPYMSLPDLPGPKAARMITRAK